MSPTRQSILADAAQAFPASFIGEAQPIDGPAEPVLFEESDSIGYVELEHRRHVFDGARPSAYRWPAP